MQQLENDLDQAQENLLAANSKLEEKDKALQTVSSLYEIRLSPVITQRNLTLMEEKRPFERKRGKLKKLPEFCHFVAFVTDGRRRLGGFLTETEGREKDIRGKRKEKNFHF